MPLFSFLKESHIIWFYFWAKDLIYCICVQGKSFEISRSSERCSSRGTRICIWHLQNPNGNRKSWSEVLLMECSVLYHSFFSWVYDLHLMLQHFTFPANNMEKWSLFIAHWTKCSLFYCTQFSFKIGEHANKCSILLHELFIILYDEQSCDCSTALNYTI